MRHRSVVLAALAARRTAALAAALVTAGPLVAQAPSDPGHPRDAAALGAPRRVRATRAATAPRLTGRLDDPAWRQAAAATDFVQQSPAAGAPATERTEVRVLYTDEALYVGVRCYDRDPARIAAPLARRDASDLYSDWAHVVVDSYHDRRTAFRFAVNPANVQQDALLYGDTQNDPSWDAVWTSATSRDSLGWTAEFRIPLSQLRFSRADTTWGVEFVREIARKSERDLWAPVPPTAQRYVSLFGELTGLRDLGPARRVELFPYARTSLTRAPSPASPGAVADPFYRRNATGAKVGGDVRYPLTPGLTLNATVNPDFGQVEADPSIVNLTAFEPFFPERRPFFVEGTGIFNLGLGLSGYEQLFYSRRVGRPPQGSVPDTAVYSDPPTETSILGAAKLVGRAPGGWSLGLLDGVTRRVTAPYVDGTGQRLSSAVEPATNYAVLRAIKDFQGGQSAVGGAVTATSRGLGGTGLGDLLRSSAYTGALDGRVRFGGGLYEATALAVGSVVTGSPAAIARTQRSSAHFFQRPDNRHVQYDTTRTSLTGGSLTGTVAKLNGAWTWLAVGIARTPEFEVNDLGYMQLADYVTGAAQLRYAQYTPGRVLNDWGVTWGVDGSGTFGWERTGTGASVNARARLRSFWSGYASARRNLWALSPTELRGGPALRTPPGTKLSAGTSSDARRPVYGSVDVYGTWEDDTRAHTAGASGTVNVRPTTALTLALGPELDWRATPWQYVAQPAAGGVTHYVYGALKQRTAALTARINYTVSPSLSFQFYGQPFVSAGAYSALKEVADPRAPQFAARFRAYAPGQIAYDSAARGYRVRLPTGDTLRFGNPDFDLKQFRSTAVVRWEYRPGSALFVVWSQSRTAAGPDGDFALGRDVHALFGTPGTNVFLVKASYWFGQ